MTLQIFFGVVILLNVLLFSLKGIRNRYSGTLLGIIDVLVCTGCVMIYSGNFIVLGIVLVFLASPLLMGFKTIQGASPKKAGLITFFGKRTKSEVEGLTLLLHWLPFGIIDVVEFEMQLTDVDIPIENIRSHELDGSGVRMNGIVSMGLRPDKTELGAYDDAKGMNGIKLQLDEALMSMLQDIAHDGLGRDWKWLEQHSNEIATILRTRLEDPVSKVNTRSMGFKIDRLNVKLRPINPKLIEADEDAQIEMLERKPEKTDTATINMQAQDRLQMYTAWASLPENLGKKIPSLKDCRDEVMFERLAKASKVTITQGSRNVNLTTAQT